MWTLGSKTFVYTACYKGKRNEYQGFRYSFLVLAVSLHRNSERDASTRVTRTK